MVLFDELYSFSFNVYCLYYYSLYEVIICYMVSIIRLLYSYMYYMFVVYTDIVIDYVIRL